MPLCAITPSKPCPSVQSSSSQQTQADCRPLIALTEDVVRHLLGSLIWPSPCNAPFVLTWSDWRRHHEWLFDWFPIERHVLVKATASPDDPSLSDYWKQRQVKSAKDLTISKQKIAKRQEGRCLECFKSLFNDEEIQIHQQIPRSLGGNNSYSNLVLVHLLCHQQIHAKAKWAMDECQKDNDQEVLTDKSSTTRRSKLKEKMEPCCS